MLKLFAVALAVSACCLNAAGASAQSHPDLTGVWMAPFKIHAAGFPIRAGSTEWAPASAGDPRKKHIPTLDEMMKAADARNARLIASRGDPAVLGFGVPHPPRPFLTPAGATQEKAFDPALYEKHDLGCFPFNVFDRLGGGLGALDIVQNPAQIMMATEINGHNFPRIIYMDGRSDKDAFASYEGYSVGRWNGATLHVVTTKIKGGYFNRDIPLSEDAQLIEDYTVVGAGESRKLEEMQTVVDPANHTEPLVRVSYLDWRPDLEVHDFPCEEGKDDQAEMAIKPVT